VPFTRKGLIVTAMLNLDVTDTRIIVFKIQAGAYPVRGESHEG